MAELPFRIFCLTTVVGLPLSGSCFFPVSEKLALRSAPIICPSGVWRSRNAHSPASRQVTTVDLHPPIFEVFWFLVGWLPWRRYGRHDQFVCTPSMQIHFARGGWRDECGRIRRCSKRKDGSFRSASKRNVKVSLHSAPRSSDVCRTYHPDCRLAQPFDRGNVDVKVGGCFWCSIPQVLIRKQELSQGFANSIEIWIWGDDERVGDLVWVERDLGALQEFVTKRLNFVECGIT